MSHLLVTNDFPPKVGGIQSYLWELWRRLPPDRVSVLTTPHEGAARFDAEQPFPVRRVREPVLLPRPGLASAIDRRAADAGAKLVVLDPALPLGLVGPRLSVPYALVLHGAEVTVPARLPGSSHLLRRVLAGARLVIAAGTYPAAEAVRLAGDAMPPLVNVPPGVDTRRFRPLAAEERRAARRRFGLPEDGPLVTSVSRLVPRKGMDVLIEAAARLAANRLAGNQVAGAGAGHAGSGAHPGPTLAIAGAGRDRRRLERLAARHRAPVRFLGRVPDDDLPALYGCGDVFAMLCRNRWAGLEQEGFGIVFLEAAACGVPEVAGHSGGAAEAVAHGETGLVVRDPRDPAEAAAAIGRLLDDRAMAARYGEATRRRAVEQFDYDVLARRLDAALAEHGG